MDGRDDHRDELLGTHLMPEFPGFDPLTGDTGEGAYDPPESLGNRTKRPRGYQHAGVVRHTFHAAAS